MLRFSNASLLEQPSRTNSVREPRLRRVPPFLPGSSPGQVWLNEDTVPSQSLPVHTNDRAADVPKSSQPSQSPCSAPCFAAERMCFVETGVHALPPAWGADAFRCDPAPHVHSVSQEEAAGGAPPGGHLLVLPLEDLQPQLLLSLQVLRAPGSPDGADHRPGDARRLPGRLFPQLHRTRLRLVWRAQPRGSQLGHRSWGPRSNTSLLAGQL